MLGENLLVRKPSQLRFTCSAHTHHANLHHSYRARECKHLPCTLHSTGGGEPRGGKVKLRSDGLAIMMISSMIGGSWATLKACTSTPS